MKHINASATVNRLREVLGTPMWEVTVTGAIPYPYTRVYVIAAKTEKDAAFDGIDRFGGEMRAQEAEKCH